MRASQATRAREITNFNPYGIQLPGGLVVSGFVLSESGDPSFFQIDFTQDDIRPGDLVLNITQNTNAVVVATETIDSGATVETRVFTDTPIFSAGDEYQVWKIAQPDSACVLYIPFGGTTSVVTAGGDSVNFVCPQGKPLLIPVRIVNVTGTDYDSLIALW